MSTRMLAGLLAVAVTLLALAPAAFAQSIAERVDEVGDGKIRMSFAARPGVCGDGRGSISLDGSGWRLLDGRGEDREWDCEGGPVRVVLRVRDGAVTRIDTYVGGRWRAPADGTVDLGAVPAVGAARFFLSLARRVEGDIGGDAILPAMIADSVTVWPDLLEMAREESLERHTRKSATFWLSQAAAEAATAGLEEIVEDEDEDREVRKAAVFALSQRPSDEGVSALIRIARGNLDPAIRRQALFWLGQSEDPRAIALFEELLTKR